MNVRIRPIHRNDAVYLNQMRTMPGVFENILGYPSERLEKSESFASSVSDFSHQFAAVVRDDSGAERVIGTAGFHIASNPRMKHCATLGIMIHRDFQGKGIGDMLMKALTDLADNWLMLVRLELTVFVDNEKAIHLYEKHGFEIEGRIRKSGIRNGEYVDSYMMSRIRNC
ncbi:MAG: GNAT family N-acetyltransferase [Proteocatella sp.]|nr:GNAT family N-acetyltransferase [Proteocatella sp.]